MENPIKMDDLGVHQFLETSLYIGVITPFITGDGFPACNVCRKYCPKDFPICNVGKWSILGVILWGWKKNIFWGLNMEPHSISVRTLTRACRRVKESELQKTFQVLWNMKTKRHERKHDLNRIAFIQQQRNKPTNKPTNQTHWESDRDHTDMIVILVWVQFAMVSAIPADIMCLDTTTLWMICSLILLPCAIKSLIIIVRNTNNCIVMNNLQAMRSHCFEGRTWKTRITSNTCMKKSTYNPIKQLNHFN